MSTRTAKLVTAVVLTSATIVRATVPAGETWIVKSVLAQNWGGASGSLQIGCSDPTNSVGVYFVNQTLAAGAIAEWEGWVVLKPGDQVFTVLSASSVSMWVSGTRLLGVL